MQTICIYQEITLTVSQRNYGPRVYTLVAYATPHWLSGDHLYTLASCQTYKLCYIE